MTNTGEWFRSRGHNRLVRYPALHRFVFIQCSKPIKASPSPCHSLIFFHNGNSPIHFKVNHVAVFLYAFQSANCLALNSLINIPLSLFHILHRLSLPIHLWPSNVLISDRHNHPLVTTSICLAVDPTTCSPHLVDPCLVHVNHGIYTADNPLSPFVSICQLTFPQ